MHTTETKYAVGISAAAALVLAAAFMPWGEVATSPELETPFGEVEFRAIELQATFTAWNSYLPLGDARIPNWLVVVAAVGAVLLSWCRAAAVWSSPVVVPLLVAGYGLAHSLYLVGWLIVSDNGRLGIGSVLTLIAFGAMVALFVGQYRLPEAERVERARSSGRMHGRPTG